MQTIQLKHPFEYEGQTYHEVQLRRSNPGDMERMDMTKGNEMTKAIHLMAHLCEVPPDVIRHLDMVDYMRINQEITDFLPDTHRLLIDMPS